LSSVGLHGLLPYLGLLLVFIDQFPRFYRYPGCN